MGLVHRAALAAFFLLNGGDVMAFDIEAHRGGRALLPENTLPSFANALSLGVDTLELDIGVTRDGVIVVSHERGLNPDLARGADGNYVAPPGTPLVRLTLEEVRRFDVGQIRPGSKYAAQFPDQRAVPQTRIPTLKEVIDLVRKSGDDHVRLNIETKIDPNHPQESPEPERFVALLLDLVRSEKFESRVIVQSFDWRTLQLVQKLAPGIPTVYLTIQAGSAPTVLLDNATVWTAGFNPAKHGFHLDDRFFAFDVRRTEVHFHAAEDGADAAATEVVHGDAALHSPEEGELIQRLAAAGDRGRFEGRPLV